jgi:hypothetical protein
VSTTGAIYRPNLDAERRLEKGDLMSTQPGIPLAPEFVPLVPYAGIERREGYAEVGDQRLHDVEAGEGPLVVRLHGFPEFWFGWPSPTL